MFSGLTKLKDALDDVIQETQHPTPAGHGKTQEEVRNEIHGEERKVHEIQKKTGWSDKVCFLPMVQSCMLIAMFSSRVPSKGMTRNVGSKTSY